MNRTTLLGAVAFGAAVVVALSVRSCRSDEQILSQMVDDARDALVQGERERFLGYFAADVVYRKTGGRAEIGRDFDRWNQRPGLGRIAVLERAIVVERAGGASRAKITLQCDVGAGMQSFATVSVDLGAERRPEGWVVTSFDWR